MAGLVSYLSKGWDKHSGNIVGSENLDVDTTGILYLTQPMKEKNNTRKEIESTPEPFLKEQAEHSVMTFVVYFFIKMFFLGPSS